MRRCMHCSAPRWSRQGTIRFTERGKKARLIARSDFTDLRRPPRIGASRVSADLIAPRHYILEDERFVAPYIDLRRPISTGHYKDFGPGPGYQIALDLGRHRVGS